MDKIENKGEIIFYTIVGIGTFIFELGNINGLGLCLFLPVTLTIIYFGIQYINKGKENKK